jgi:monoamine oxidase
MQNRQSCSDSVIGIGYASIYLSRKNVLVKRRKAIQRLGLGLSAGLLLPELLSSCKKDDAGPEVKYNGSIAVIGAGAAGLYAADILRSKGISVYVLEASTELGGRIKSLRNQSNINSQTIADFPVELGAEISYGSNSIWGKIIKNHNVPTVALDPATDQYLLDMMAKSAGDWGSDPDFTAVESFVSGLPNFGGTGLSISDAANVSQRAAALLNAQVGNFYGGSDPVMGAQGIAEGLKLITHDNQRLIMKTNPLQDILLSQFSEVTPQVQTGVVVKHIDYSGTGIVITDQNSKTYSAGKAIVTVPLTVLKGGDVSFNPGLPASMTSSWGNLGMDASIRVSLDFTKNFWGEDIGILWGGTTGPQYFNAGSGRSQYTRTLSITINGPKASELSAMGSDMVLAILDELDNIFAGQATKYIRTDLDTGQMLSIIQDWTKEPYIQGGYSYPLVNGTIDDRKNIGAQVGTNLFFAGEATDISGDAGTINGALASAERVAEEVVKSITG